MSETQLELFELPPAPPPKKKIPKRIMLAGCDFTAKLKLLSAGATTVFRGTDPRRLFGYYDPEMAHFEGRSNLMLLWQAMRENRVNGFTKSKGREISQTNVRKEASYLIHNPRQLYEWTNAGCVPVGLVQIDS